MIQLTISRADKAHSSYTIVLFCFDVEIFSDTA